MMRAGKTKCGATGRGIPMDEDLLNTATYSMDENFMRIKMAKWGLLLTKADVERAWRREKSVRRNSKGFMKKKKGATPDLYK